MRTSKGRGVGIIKYIKTGDRIPKRTFFLLNW